MTSSSSTSNTTLPGSSRGSGQHGQPSVGFHASLAIALGRFIPRHGIDQYGGCHHRSARVASPQPQSHPVRLWRESKGRGRTGAAVSTRKSRTQHRNPRSGRSADSLNLTTLALPKKPTSPTVRSNASQTPKIHAHPVHRDGPQPTAAALLLRRPRCRPRPARWRSPADAR